MKRYYKSIRFLLAIIFAAFCLQLSARNINVRGKVIQDGTNEPLYGVGIYNAANNKFIGATNDEGRYTVNVPDDATLVFKVMGSEEQTVDVNGRITIEMCIRDSNEKWLADKNQVSVSTASFINERLAVIENELGHVDSDIASYQSEHLIPNVQQAASMYMTEDVYKRQGCRYSQRVL